MRATRLEFRFRVAVVAVIYTLGFVLFWNFPAGFATGQTIWLALSSLLAGTHLLTLGEATLFVTMIAFVAVVAGAALRVWSTACLGAEAMTGETMHAGQIVATGPYRHLRNPLYLGTWLVTIAIILLMPIAGAIFVLAGITIFLLRIIGEEERYLGESLGQRYQEYCLRVPRLLPAVRPAVTASGSDLRWMQAIASEVFPVGYAVCFALLAWRYNAQLLTRCLLICFGLSMIVQALMQARSPSSERSGK